MVLFRLIFDQEVYFMVRKFYGLLSYNPPSPPPPPPPPPRGAKAGNSITHDASEQETRSTKEIKMAAKQELLLVGD